MDLFLMKTIKEGVRQERAAPISSDRHLHFGKEKGCGQKCLSEGWKRGRRG